jgi:hypothetical protein
LRVTAALLLSLLLGLSLTGCGNNEKGGGVASATGKPSASASGGSGAKEAGLAYARCMRANGVPNFPDPQVNDSGQIRFDPPKDIPDYVMNAAEDKCRGYLPFDPKAGSDPQRIEQLRKYAQCIREHGIPDYPDPQDDGSLGFDPNKLGLSGPDDPKLKAAEEKCRQLQPSAPPGANTGQGNG